jgi:hypothetical protein
VAAVVGSVEQIPSGLGLFDTVLLLGNNLGLLASAERAAVVLGNLAAVTKPRGQLLGSGLDPYRTDTETHLAYHDWNRQRGRLPGQVRMRVRDGAIATPWFDYLFVSLAELQEILTSMPWQLRDVAEEDAPGPPVMAPHPHGLGAGPDDVLITTKSRADLSRRPDCAWLPHVADTESDRWLHPDVEVRRSRSHRLVVDLFTQVPLDCSCPTPMLC